MQATMARMPSGSYGMPQRLMHRYVPSGSTSMPISASSAASLGSSSSAPRGSTAKEPAPAMGSSECSASRRSMAPQPRMGRVPVNVRMRRMARMSVG